MSVSIAKIKEKDMSQIYNKGQKAIFVSDQNEDILQAPTSPALTRNKIEFVSGRRKGINTKNDPGGKKQSEKRVSSRVPKFENGELKEKLDMFTPVKIKSEMVAEAKDNNEVHTGVNMKPLIVTSDNRPASDLALDFKTLEKSKSDRGLKTSPTGEHLVNSNPIRHDSADHLLEKESAKSKPKRRRKKKTPPKDKVEVIGGNNDRLSSRRAENSRKSIEGPLNSNRREERSPVRRSKNTGLDQIRPRSPHRQRDRKNIGIKLGGRSLSSGELDDLVSNSDSRSSSTRSSEISSRTQIKSRKEAIDRKLSEKYSEGFYPEDDDHLAGAIKIALEESKKKSVQEALDQGYELNAKVLESITRPDAINEVIEELVSQRREKIKIRKKRPSKRREISPPINTSSKIKSSGGDSIIIETMDDDDAEEDLHPVIKSKPKVTIVEDTKLPGTNIKVESRPIPKKQNEISDENVKMPMAHRKARPGDYLEPADALGQRDYVYDPLGVDIPFGESGPVGDDMYEESSEDEGKLTVDEKKDEMLYRFKLVKESYPNIALPRITKKMKLAKMVRLFENVMSRIKLKVKTKNFKIFLIGGFLIMQFLASKFGLKDYASGFTVNQMYSMKHYERFLRELGESDWTGIGIELPVMVRLPFYMCVNLGIFVVAKFFFKKTGKDYTAQFHKLYAQLVGGDDYSYIEESESKGLDAGEEDGGGGGGIFGLLKSFLGMMGGGGGNEDRPKRSEAGGPTYHRRRKQAK